MSQSEKIERMKQVLADAGIRMSVGGCGCCHSPWVRFEHNGEVIVAEGDDPLDDVTFDMFEKDKG